jgi:chemotaxis protein methyltransferase CheR
MSTSPRILPDSTISALADLLAAQCGLAFPPERWRDLEAFVRTASAECQCDAQGFADRFLRSIATPEEKKALVSRITVGETYFFRETRGLRLLVEEIVPKAENRTLRIWSAGCATGEEAYSIAMTLRRSVPNLDHWNVSIVGIDVNERALEMARRGVYGKWSFRGVPESLQNTYFSPVEGDRWEVRPSIRKMVRFEAASLMQDSLPGVPGGIDVIFCCNVLMYFREDRLREVVGRLRRQLKEGGWLIVAPVEHSPLLASTFRAIPISGGTVYRKGTAPHTRPAGQPLEAILPAAVETADGTSEADSAELLLPPDGVPDRALTLARMARESADQGNLEQAFRWCEMAIATGKADAGTHYLRAAILQEKGDLDEAMRSLRRTLYLDPAFAIGHFAMGNLAAQRGKADESARHFSNSLAILNSFEASDTLPESGGLTVGRLKELIKQRTNG